ncbi:MAG TPA: hypothetical protein VF699_02405 [Caulobacteraceae bacterium]
MEVRFVFACAAAAALLAGAVQAQTKAEKADGIVKDLYVEWTAADLDPEKYFVKDVAEALKPKPIDFDYRFDTKSTDIGAVDFASEQVADASGRIRADFMVGKKKSKVLYTVCKREDGTWRVKDAAVPGKWTLRDLLKLPAADSVAGC